MLKFLTDQAVPLKIVFYISTATGRLARPGRCSLAIHCPHTPLFPPSLMAEKGES